MLGSKVDGESHGCGLSPGSLLRDFPPGLGRFNGLGIAVQTIAAPLSLNHRKRPLHKPPLHQSAQQKLDLSRIPTRPNRVVATPSVIITQRHSGARSLAVHHRQHGAIGSNHLAHAVAP